MNADELNKILDEHEKWLNSDSGKCANLRGANLYGADLRSADLRCANLYGAILGGADLRGANLYGADLRSADLRCANLYGANLYGADLRSADLGGADLRCANLENVIANEFTAGYWLVCQEEGSFIGWKKCQDNVIVKLLIPEDAKRSSATTRKCRCDKAIVLDVIGAKIGISKFENDFVYRKGETVSVSDFDEDRWNECSAGIHFFITKKEAEVY